MYIEIDEVDFAGYKTQFLREYNRVEPYRRRVLTDDKNLLLEYRTELVRTYNNLVNYLANVYENGTHKTKTECVDKIKPFLDKLKVCFDLLSLEYNWPSYALAVINIEQIRTRVSNDSDKQLFEKSNSVEPVVTSNNEDVGESSLNKTKNTEVTESGQSNSRQNSTDSDDPINSKISQATQDSHISIPSQKSNSSENHQDSDISRLLEIEQSVTMHNQLQI